MRGSFGIELGDGSAGISIEAKGEEEEEKEEGKREVCIRWGISFFTFLEISFFSSFLHLGFSGLSWITQQEIY